MRTYLTLLFVIPLLTCKAQLVLDTTHTIAHLIENVFTANGIKVGNIKCVTNKRAIAYYMCPTNKIGLNKGLLICSGYATHAIGPNSSPGISSTLDNYNKKWRGDRSLNKLAKGLKVYDVSVIEFDFIPLFNKVVFEYSFGSEEYKEYVGSKFNDVFGFFVTGLEMKQKNVALLPQDKNFVAINNINHKTNDQYFIDNDPFINNTLLKNVAFKPKISFWQSLCRVFSRKTKQNDSVLFYTNGLKKKLLDEQLLQTFQFDAFTKKMKVTFFVTPYRKYHLKIAIGDVGDTGFDSGVFLEEKSFSAIKDSLDPKYSTYLNKKMPINFDSILGIKKSNPSISLVEEEEESKVLFENTIINFGVDSYTIPDSCKVKLDQLAVFLYSYPQAKLSITGYTDNTGKTMKNKLLSEKRASAVTYYLMEKGVLPKRINYVGFSAENPIGDNDTETGRAQNRRVEIDLEE